MGRMSDSELYTQVQQDNKEAIEQLYERYEKIVFSFSYKMLSQKELAEEAVQDVFTKLWRQNGIFSEHKGKFSSWLLTITRNVCIDLMRKQNISQIVLLESDIDQEQTESVEATVTWNEERRILRRAVSALSEEQQDMLELFYFKGYSQAEIANEREVPLGTVKGRLRMALKHLRKFYGEKGDKYGHENV